MEIFLSWSGTRSKALAVVLYNWLPEVIQQVKPWMSSESIAKGQRWSGEIGSKLSSGSQGIVCVTADNFQSPWLNFEAGALATSLSEAMVRPVLLDIVPTDVTGPVAQFQATMANHHEDMFKLVSSLNLSCPEPLNDARLRKAFERSWQDFQTELSRIPEGDSAVSRRAERQPEEMLREILEIVRGLQRPLSDLRYDVVLESDNGNKIEVIKLVRELTRLGLKESKDLVESAPCVVGYDLDRATVAFWISTIQRGGGTAFGRAAFSEPGRPSTSLPGSSDAKGSRRGQGTRKHA